MEHGENVNKEFTEIGSVGLTTLLNVSARGTGLYLFIPKKIVEVYGIMNGDRIEVKLGKMHREKRFVKGESKR